MTIEGHQPAVEANQQAEDSHHKKEGWFSRKTTQSCESSGSAQGRTKNEANPFPILGPGHRTLPQPPGTHDSSVLGALVHLILGLRSAIDEGDVILRQANDAWGREISFVAQTCTGTERGHSSTNKASCPYVAKQGQGSASLRPWIPQWSKYQDSTENQNAISSTELRRHRRILQIECSSYRKLIEEVLVQVVPAIESHSNELQFIMEKYIARDRKTRCPFQERHRS
ncbi:hypothetical protein BGZ61DRAFT_487710 [Ilyonectria robusta]|uniref:uncharacterized protein n=1 Tax=Ilyonectria robusta TaxID=1079257 RepID=UPI001E8E520B|nr:uncharacterized protein BGZ61DRAFT_487710 [Ilyonectria robusta]KAH8650787.1 hypothetical protein BGZ61DRAFT_487710 [Ilyonectria robusta]